MHQVGITPIPPLNPDRRSRTCHPTNLSTSHPHSSPAPSARSLARPSPTARSAFGSAAAAAVLPYTVSAPIILGLTHPSPSHQASHALPPIFRSLVLASAVPERFPTKRLNSGCRCHHGVHWRGLTPGVLGADGVALVLCARSFLVTDSPTRPATSVH